MLCVMWLPNERTFYSFPSSLKCFTFLLVWKREKPSHPSTCVLLMRLNWKFAIQKCRLIFLKSFLPWDARSPSILIPIGRSSQFDFVFVTHTLSCLFIGLFPLKRERLSVRPFASVFVAKATILSQQKRRERKKNHFNTQCEPQSIC